MREELIAVAEKSAAVMLKVPCKGSRVFVFPINVDQCVHC